MAKLVRYGQLFRIVCSNVGQITVFAFKDATIIDGTTLAFQKFAGFAESQLSNKCNLKDNLNGGRTNMIQHKGPISSVACHDSKYIATAGYDNQVILWSAKDKTPLGRVSHDHLANFCTFSPCGKYLLTSSSDHTARCYRIPDLKLLTVYSDHEDDVEMITFNQDCTLIATACRDKIARVFKITGELIAKLIGHSADVLTVTFNNNSLITTSDDGTIKKWALDGSLIQTVNTTGIETDTLVVTKKGLIISGDDTGEICLIENAKRTSIPCHSAGIKRLVLNNTGDKLCSISYDRSCKVWHLLENSEIRLLQTFSLPNIIWARSCAFLNEDQVVFGTFGSSYAMFDLKKKEWDTSKIASTPCLNSVLYCQGDTFAIGDAGVLLKNGNPVKKFASLCNFLIQHNGILLTGGHSGEVFNALTGEAIFQHSSPLNCATTTVFNSAIYTLIGAYDGSVIVFRSNNHGEPTFFKTTRLHGNAIKGISANKDMVCTVSANREIIRIPKLDLLNEKVQTEALPLIGHNKIANGCCAISENSFASISRDLKLRIWPEKSDTSIVIQTPHSHSIKCLAADIKNNLIATGSYSGQIAVFNFKTKKWTKDLKVSESGISSICLSPSGFLASSYDGNIYAI